MKLSLELYAETPFYIREDSFIKLMIRSHGFIVEDTKSQDYYESGVMALSQKRIAGLARDCSYSMADHLCSSEILQARPGAYVVLTHDQVDDIALIIQTNIILDPGLLRHQLGIRIVNEKGKTFDIPLARPDIQIYWDGRGRYVIPITEFINNKIIAVA